MVVRYRLHIKCRWWVFPLIALAKLNDSIGIPVDAGRLANIIGRHGIRLTFKAE